MLPDLLARTLRNRWLQSAALPLAMLISAAPPAAATAANPTVTDTKQARPSNTREDRERAEIIDETLEEILDFNLNISALIAGRDGAWEQAQRQVREFRNRMDTAINPALVTQANDFSTRPTIRLRDQAERNATRMGERLATSDIDRTLAGTREATMFARYGSLLSMGEQLRQLQRLYPDSAAIREANQTASSVLAQLGSFDDVEGRANANARARAAENRLIGAVRRNSALERSFVNAFWASPWANEYRGGEVLRMNLTSSGWTVRTNALGTPISRDTGTSFAVRAPDGKCYAIRGIFEQRYAGGGYGSSRYASGSTSEILCENI